MAGTKEGGIKARDINLRRDPLFYHKIGTKGGRNGHTGGFYANPELARIAGRKGGKISKRKPIMITYTPTDNFFTEQPAIAVAKKPKKRFFIFTR